MRKLLTIATLGLALTGCNNNILGFEPQQLLSQTQQGYSGTVPTVWNLYTDALQTNGWFQGLAVWDNYHWVTVDNASTVMPYSGSHCLKVRYDAAGGGTPNWAELAFIHTPDYSGYAGTAGKDISAGGYHWCRFMLRTSVASSVPFQMDGVSAVSVAATPAWQAVSIALPSPATQTAVKTYFQINTPTVMPVDIFIDDLRYEQ